MEETPALGPVYAECVDLSVMISKYPHDPKLINFQEPQNADDRVSAGPPDYKNQNTAELAVMIKDMELAGFKLGNVMTVMGDRNGSRNGMFACFDVVSLTPFKYSSFMSWNTLHAVGEARTTKCWDEIGWRTARQYCGF